MGCSLNIEMSDVVVVDVQHVEETTHSPPGVLRGFASRRRCHASQNTCELPFAVSRPRLLRSLLSPSPSPLTTSLRSLSSSFFSPGHCLQQWRGNNNKTLLLPPHQLPQLQQITEMLHLQAVVHPPHLADQRPQDPPTRLHQLNRAPQVHHRPRARRVFPRLRPPVVSLSHSRPRLRPRTSKSHRGIS